jgi:hypothetical protein
VVAVPWVVSDELWSRLEPLLPDSSGKPDRAEPLPDRLVLQEILSTHGSARSSRRRTETRRLRHCSHQDLPGEGAGRHQSAKKRLADARARLRRHQAAIEAGVDPSALVEVINQAQAERVAAETELANQPATAMITDAEIHAMIDSLGDVGAALSDAKPDSLSQLYRRLRLDLHYKPHENAVEVTPIYV